VDVNPPEPGRYGQPPEELLHVDVAALGERLHVTIDGEVDSATSGMLERDLLEAVRGGDRDVDLDLSGVGFLDSSGLRTLVLAQQNLAGRGLELVLVGSTPMIDRLLEITGLAALFSPR
jgi:anti-sigma B factor antagonist